MAKQEILIFGDSYSDRFSELDVIFSWPRGLEKNYSVTNFSHRGEGPQGVLNSIHQCILKNPALHLKNKEMIAIVMLPEICRYPFSFYKNVKDRVYGQVHLNSSDDFKDVIRQELGEDKLKFLIDFKEYYLKSINNQKIEEMKTLSLLDHYSKYFKKMLIWPTDDVQVFNDPADKQLFDNLSNYDFVPITMGTISGVREDISYCWPDDRYRMNHISLLHHRIMYDEIVSWIETGKIPEDKFVYDPNAGKDGNILNEL